MFVEKDLNITTEISPIVSTVRHNAIIACNEFRSIARVSKRDFPAETGQKSFQQTAISGMLTTSEKGQACLAAGVFNLFKSTGILTVARTPF
ncbi:hypothetical protein [Thalassospira povalilytica]|uniref:hypothetical protein n=1 Tax=Thalassospira povalilytica TaxID=732237 RepID=UPI00147916B6|nr:hypothetical protein [Thalassospira povalilytica]